VTLENWTWGLSLISLTIAIHVAGVIFMALRGEHPSADQKPKLSYVRHVAAIQIGLIGTVGLLLAALHGVEAAL